MTFAKLFELKNYLYEKIAYIKNNFFAQKIALGQDGKLMYKNFPLF